MVEQSPIQSRDVVQVKEGGSIPPTPLHFRNTTKIILEEVPLELARDFVLHHHYSKVMPKQTKEVLGFYRDEKLVGIVTLGWGVRPTDTIRQLFPSLEAKDYREIGKMCVEDSEPHGTESHLLSMTLQWLKIYRSELKVLFTWADALWGKPGYIYQAANFYYGGAIQTEVYMDAKGHRFHPRQLPAILRAEGVSEEEIRQHWHADNGIGVSRPSKQQLAERGWKHFFGQQFRYVYFLCPPVYKKILIRESAASCTITYSYFKHSRDFRPVPAIRTVLHKSILWRRPTQKNEQVYPKLSDIWWKVDDGKDKDGKPSKPIRCDKPNFTAAFDPARDS